MSQGGIETPYTASYLIFRKEGKIAFLLRSHTGWMDGHYSLVAGRVDKGEPFIGAAVREAAEEAGASIKPENLKPLMTVHRRHPDSVWVDLFFEVIAWEGELYNAEPDKHGELAWLDPANLPENVIPYIVFALGQIQAGKTYAEYGWTKA